MVVAILEVANLHTRCMWRLQQIRNSEMSLLRALQILPQHLLHLLHLQRIPVLLPLPRHPLQQRLQVLPLLPQQKTQRIVPYALRPLSHQMLQCAVLAQVGAVTTSISVACEAGWTTVVGQVISLPVLFAEGKSSSIRSVLSPSFKVEIRQI